MKQCIKCTEPMNNPLSGLCVNHLEEIRLGRQKKFMAYIEELKLRGPILAPEDCEHVTVDFDHCFDCGQGGELIVCRRCKEWTLDISPCC